VLNRHIRMTFDGKRLQLQVFGQKTAPSNLTANDDNDLDMGMSVETLQSCAGTGVHR